MKEGCIFCALEENGDIPEDTEDLFDEKFDFIQIQIGNNANDFNLAITDGKYGASVLYSKNLKFSFCPMCGRNLREAREKINDRSE